MPRPFGTDRVEIAGGGRLRIVCGQPKSWTPRKPASPGMALHPGTAVRWEDDLWEVVSAEETADGGVRYELRAWDDRNAIRVLLPYDEASEAEREADGRDLGRRRRQRWLALNLAPHVGLLPGRVQERLETELGLGGTTLTLASIAAPLAFGTYALLMTLASGFGAGVRIGGPAVEPLLPLLAYFLPESLLRLAVALGQGRPIGSVLGLPLYPLARLTGLVESPPAVAGPEAPGVEHRHADRYLMLEPLLSFLPVADQLRLHRERAFAPTTWGKRTAWFLLVYPGLTAPAHAYDLLAESGGLPSLLLLALAAGLGLEQVIRLRALSRGEPAPSILGRLVAPIARPLLGGMPPAASPRGRAVGS
ncbi:MAG: hypothetical protein KJ062_00755 [Thermoanaerobaculia bacterium]|nr:hypothetical protein [Thermoanaerobaculia bacterium]